ncbi:hypothetical protein WA026_013582, partial [Henosepilachna vigintioctopunctata]
SFESVKVERSDNYSNEVEVLNNTEANGNESSIKTKRSRQKCNVTGPKSKNYKCESCDYVTTRKNNFQTHVESLHLKLRNHKCDKCDYSSSSKSNLDRHIKSVHLKLRNHKCDLCDYCSSEKSHLRLHVKTEKLQVRIMRLQIIIKI